MILLDSSVMSHDIKNATHDGQSMKLFTTKEAADLLGLKPQTLELWRMQTKGPAFVKMGRSVRYREEDLQAYIHSLHTQTSTSQDLPPAPEPVDPPVSQDKLYDLPGRVRRAIIDNGLTEGQAASMTDRDWTRLRGIGGGAIYDIRKVWPKPDPKANPIRHTPHPPPHPTELHSQLQKAHQEISTLRATNNSLNKEINKLKKDKKALIKLAKLVKSFWIEGWDIDGDFHTLNLHQVESGPDNHLYAYSRDAGEWLRLKALAAIYWDLEDGKAGYCFKPGRYQSFDTIGHNPRR